jgi:hypothetical protein
MRIVMAQMRVERELAKNRETICSMLQRARPEDWVVFPEGALTRYFPHETDYLAATAREDVEAALAGLRALVEQKAVPLSSWDSPGRRRRMAQLSGSHLARRRGPGTTSTPSAPSIRGTLLAATSCPCRRWVM